VCRAGEIHRHLVEVCFVRVMSLIKLRVWCNYFGNVKREVDCKQLPGRPSMCHADARSREDRGIKMAVIARDVHIALSSAHSTFLE